TMSPGQSCRGTPTSWRAAWPISNRMMPWPAWCCMAEIVFDQVAKDCGNGPVVRAVSRTIGEGEFCVFVGPSGCGKSTLLRMVAGLESITAGEIRLCGPRGNAHPPG